MEREPCISALAYKGSIPEAILEAKRQKKLFVVYISGMDGASNELEKITWTDSKVAESLSKYCILLHIPEGSNDAANFAAIYPQKSVPSISAIGYNGVQLWHSEGYVSAEVLVSSLERAWLSLHIKETTATVLSAALASRKTEPSVPGSSDMGLSDEGSSSGTVLQSPSTDKSDKPLEATGVNSSEEIERDKSHQEKVEEQSSSRSLHGKPLEARGVNSSKEIEGDKSHQEKVESSSISLHSDQSWSAGDGQSVPPTKEAREPSSRVVNMENSVIDRLSSGAEDGNPAVEKMVGSSGVPKGDSQSKIAGTNEFTSDEKTECLDVKKLDVSDNGARLNASNDVHLNIRLPNGVSLQEKFSVSTTLGIIKVYVDRNQGSGIGSYDLAIPYPRKVFCDEDLGRSLSQLGLLNRQTLIVVPRQGATSYHKGGSSLYQTTNTSSLNVNEGGYFTFVRRILSYINPLAYLRGNAESSSTGQSQTGTWEYNPNPAPRSNLARGDRSHSSNQESSMTGRNDNGGGRTATSRYGSNIHTLKHEDDARFGDRNTFWNGNSTQYGGNNNGQ